MGMDGVSRLFCGAMRAVLSVLCARKLISDLDVDSRKREESTFKLAHFPPFS